MSSHRSASGPVWKRLGIPLGGVAVLVGAMLADTTFVNEGEVGSFVAAEFSAEEYTDQLLVDLTQLMEETAVEAHVLAEAMREDPEQAGEQYGNDIGSNRYGFAIEALGTAVEVDESFARIELHADPDVDVRLPLSTALNGTPIRDALGVVSFGDFRDQTQYQAVANEIRSRVEEDVIGPLDLEGLEGREIRVVGAWLSNGPPDTFVIHPVIAEVLE